MGLLESGVGVDPAVSTQLGGAVGQYGQLRDEIRTALIDLDKAQAAFNHRYRMINPARTAQQAFEAEDPDHSRSGASPGRCFSRFDHSDSARAAPRDHRRALAGSPDRAPDPRRARAPSGLRRSEPPEVRRRARFPMATKLGADVVGAFALTILLTVVGSADRQRDTRLSRSSADPAPDHLHDVEGAASDLPRWRSCSAPSRSRIRPSCRRRVAGSRPFSSVGRDAA